MSFFFDKYKKKFKNSSFALSKLFNIRTFMAENYTDLCDDGMYFYIFIYFNILKIDNYKYIIYY